MFNRKHLQLNRAAITVVLLLALTLLSFFAPPSVSARAESNACGDGVYYTLSNGTLTIGGAGEMAHYNDSDAPWADRAEEITAVIVEEGVTSVGNSAFSGLKRLSSVQMADSVRSISAFAFKGCTALSSVRFSANLKNVYESAFEECTSLFSVRLPDGLYRISDKAFYRCYSLTAITIPSSVGFFGRIVFGYCEDLLYANVLCKISVLPEGTFSDCRQLKLISLPETVKETGENALKGCDGLATVYYPTESEAQSDRLASDIGRDVENFTTENILPTETIIHNAESWTTQQKADGTTKSEFTTVKETDHAVIRTTESLSNNAEVVEKAVEVVAKVEAEEGWKEVQTAIKTVKENTSSGKKTTVNIILETKKESVPGSALTTLAGEETELTLNGSNGSTVNIDCSRLNENRLDETKNYSFGYTVTKNENTTAETEKVIGKDKLNYTVQFDESQAIDQSPAVYVGKDKALSLATLYSVTDQQLNKMQTVLVDQEGVANFYISTTDRDTTYVVAIDAKDAERKDAIVPPSLYDTLGIDPSTQVTYVATEMRLMNGLNVFQVVFGVLGGVVLLSAIVGAVFFVVYRKQRLKLLYAVKSGNREVIDRVLGSDDEEEEQSEGETSEPKKKK